MSAWQRWRAISERQRIKVWSVVFAIVLWPIFALIALWERIAAVLRRLTS